MSDTKQKIIRVLLDKYEQCGELDEDGELTDVQQAQGTFADGLLYAVRIIQKYK